MAKLFYINTNTIVELYGGSEVGQVTFGSLGSV